MPERWIIFRHRKYNAEDDLIDKILPPVPPRKNKRGDYLTEYLYSIPNEWTCIPHETIKMFANRKEALLSLHKVIKYYGYNDIKDAPSYGTDIHPEDRYA